MLANPQLYCGQDTNELALETQICSCIPQEKWGSVEQGCIGTCSSITCSSNRSIILETRRVNFIHSPLYEHNITKVTNKNNSRTMTILSF